MQALNISEAVYSQNAALYVKKPPASPAPPADAGGAPAAAAQDAGGGLSGGAIAGSGAEGEPLAAASWRGRQRAGAGCRAPALLPIKVQRGGKPQERTRAVGASPRCAIFLLPQALW